MHTPSSYCRLVKISKFRFMAEVMLQLLAEKAGVKALLASMGVAPIACCGRSPSNEQHHLGLMAKLVPKLSAVHVGLSTVVLMSAHQGAPILVIRSALTVILCAQSKQY